MNYLLTLRNISQTKKNRVPHNLKKYLKRIAPVFYITGLCIRAVIYLQSKLNQKTKKEGSKISKNSDRDTYLLNKASYKNTNRAG